MSEPVTALVQAPSAGIVRASGDVVEALKEYQRIQAQLDAAMPDCIQDIRGRKFRKKVYWRGIATAFNLDVAQVSESLERGEKDWGYVVSYRATAPNGRFADGDGACFASEKRGQGQATVHNVRSHAHTRAFNRAVSNLVGFGEVSAEEVEHDAPQGPQGEPEPGSGDGPEPPKKAAQPPANNVWQGTVTVSKKEGTSAKTGKPYTRYMLKGHDGLEFSTFDRNHAAFAIEAGTSPVVITFTKSKFGLEVDFIGPAE